jgi:hypothetical protein
LHVLQLSNKPWADYKTYNQSRDCCINSTECDVTKYVKE